MLKFTSNERLQVSDEEFKRIRETLRVTKKSLDEDIGNVIEWFRKQPHLPDIMPDRNIVERLMIAQNGSTQKTKASLEMRYFRKHAMPDFFMNRDTQSRTVSEIMDSVYYVPIPKLSLDHTRLVVIKFPSSDSAKFDLCNFIYNIFLIQEIRTNEDYALGIRVLVDLENVTMNYILKCNPLLIAKLKKVFKNRQGVRLFGLHFINAHSALQNIFAILKMFFRPKMADRLFVHNSIDDLNNIFPTEILPKDYGGGEYSINDLSALWKEHLTSEEVSSYFIEEDKYLTNEEKRPYNSFLNVTEVGGSFRQLNID